MRRAASPLLRALLSLSQKALAADSARSLRDLRRTLRRADARCAARKSATVAADAAREIKKANAISRDREIRQDRARSGDAALRFLQW